MMPCLNKNSLKLLVGTADERYNHSVEYFRNTHFPQVMHRYNGSQLIAEVTEGELLEELKEVDSDGNRVYLVFGSTGSGKSELLCWLKDKWIMGVPNRPVIRISRTELNPQTLIKKCLDTLNISLDVNIDENRWGLLLKKPVTLINQMVWTALAESMESDEEIVPAALLLRPIIEQNVIEFTSQVKRGEIKKPLEVLHRDQFDSLLSHTTLDISLEYDAFRHTLSRKLDQFLFEGWDIASLFQQLSKQIKCREIRPLLLIDDLVQSVNIYATDILDQLITLEEGSWDVVIGLTPGAVQDSDKGFSLTQRIQNLDTINDRVKKLWLSDESGRDFYNLDRTQVTPYMGKYLMQLKATQGFDCSVRCPYYKQCSSISPVTDVEISELDEFEVQLLPFNSHMLKRTYDAIPLGRGKLRYMILHSREIIRFFLIGKRDVSRIVPLIKREMFAEHSDLLIKTLAEWYASEKADRIFIPGELLKFFGYNEKRIVVELNNIESSGIDTDDQPISGRVNDNEVGYDSKEVVRNWIEGREVNEELLLPLRSGVAALVHDAVKGVHMSRSFTARTSATIQRNEIVNRTRYPITLQENNDNLIINVGRRYASLQIAHFQTMKYSNKVKIFQKISNDYEIAKWIHQTELLHDRWLDSLQQALGLSLPIFVYSIKHWFQTSQIYSQSIWASNVAQYSPFKTEVSTILDECYLDWYLLRDNFFQPPDTERLTDEEFQQWFMNFKPSKDLKNYQIGNTTLDVFLSQLKASYEKYFHLLRESFRKSIQTRIIMIPFLLGSGNKKLIGFADQIIAFQEKKIITQQDFVSYTFLEQELEKQELSAQFEVTVQLYKEVMYLRKQFNTLAIEVAEFLSECNMQTNYKVDDIDFLENEELVWSELEEEKKLFTILTDELTSFKNCLALSPQILVRRLLDPQINVADIDQLQSLRRKFTDCSDRLFSKRPVGSELVTLIAQWQSIDFYKIREQIERNLHQEQTKSQLLRVIRTDLECEDIGSIYQLIETINESSIRPSIKRHIKLLVENGYSTLPPVQWKRLLEEIKEKFPSLFDVVEIRLVVGDDK